MALLAAIMRGVQAGLHQHLEGVNPVRVQGVIDGARGPLSLGDYEASCRRAGPVTTLAALVRVYRERVAQLGGLGEDMFGPLAQLEMALGTRAAVSA